MLHLGVLVLNRSYLPIHVTTVRRAFALVYQGAAHVVDSEYRSYAFDEWFAKAPEPSLQMIGTSRGPIPIPKVIVLRSYDRMPRRHVRFSRANVFARDDHTCQYCGERFAKGDLNLDHVVPRSHGGRSTWENVVTSCVDCNRRKGGRTPEQAGFRLNKKPARPRWTPLASLPLASHRHDEWRPFLRVVDRSEAREPIAV